MEFSRIPKPHCAPDSVNAQAMGIIDALLQLVVEISQQCQQVHFPELTRLLMERDQLLGQLTQLQLNDLSPEVKTWIQTNLQQCQAMDAANLSLMKAMQAGWKVQLKGVKDSWSLMEKYRAVPGEHTTRWEQA